MSAADGVPLPLWRQARARPDQPALDVQGEVTSQAALAAAADEAARRLAGLGLGPGERLAVCLPNGRDFAVLLHAAARLGAILVPLSSRLTAAERAWQLADSGARVLLAEVDPGAADGLAASAPAGAAGSSAGRRHEPGSPVRWLTVAELAARPARDVRLRDDLDLAAPATIVYTSGTTGRPKGAVLTHGNHLWSALASAQRLGALPGDRWLTPLPLYHVGGMAVLLRSALFGGTAVLHRRFEPEAVAEAMASGGLALASLVPTMLGRVLEVWGQRAAPPGFRGVLLGGGPVPVALLRRAAAAGLPVAPTYGLTEAASQVATAAPALAWPEDDVGAEPLAFTTLRVLGEDGAALGPGDLGEILVRGPTVMAGYRGDPGATAAALAGGWLHTGDIGWLDARGRLHVADRRDDLIVTGGENVYPAEVEAVLDAHPGVAESCVVGLPDETWGQAVVAVVVRRSPELGEGDLLAHARRALAGYKLPRRVVWAERLPRTAAGKLRRGALRAALSREEPR